MGHGLTMAMFKPDSPKPGEFWETPSWRMLDFPAATLEDRYLPGGNGWLWRGWLHCLVGGWPIRFNPSEKYEYEFVNGVWMTSHIWNGKYLKPPSFQIFETHQYMLLIQMFETTKQLWIEAPKNFDFRAPTHHGWFQISLQLLRL